MKRRNGDAKQNPIFEEKKKYKSSPVIGDKKLIPRVRQYLDANKHKQVVSVSSMADYLQATFSRDYGRKKKNAFRISVEKAYETVLSSIKPGDSGGDTYSRLESKHLEKSHKVLLISDSEDNPTDNDSEKSFSSDNPEYVVHQDTNAMNSVLTSMYKKQPKPSSNVGSPAAPSKPSSVSGSAPSTPKRQSANDDSDQLFLIDRTGSTALQSKNVISNTQGKQNSIQEIENISGTSRVTDNPTPQATAICTKEKPEGSMTPKVTENKKKVNSNKPASIQNDLQPKRSEKVVDDTPATEPRQKHIGKSPRKKVKAGDKTSSTKQDKKSHELQTSKTTFADIGGNDSTLKEVCKLLVHMKHPEVYERLGVTPPRGFLLHGPPGCGKTLLAHAIAGELELPLLKVAATELVSGVSGESEEKIRDMFEIATSSAPCVMFLDEIDAITPKRETASKDMERRIVSQLLTCMDDLSNSTQGHVLVIGATNRPDSLDPALRRAGRFDREIGLGIPDEDARMRILKVLCRDLRLVPEFDFRQLARGTPGYVGADLMALAREAAIVAVNRVFQELQNSSNLSTEHTGSQCAQQCPSVDGKKDFPPAANSNISLNPINDARDSDSPTSINRTTANVGVQRTIFDSPAVNEEQSESITSCRSTNVEISTKAGENSSSMDSTEQNFEAKLDTALEHTEVESDNTGGMVDEFKLVLTWLKDQPPLTPEQLDGLFLSMEDFQTALQHVQPSAKREGFATIPDVTWADIGALQGVRDELQMAIMGPVRHPEQFKALGLTNPPGILLAGPPGCGKTLLAKAVANESGINFISVKGPELLNMYVGESERAVRQVFQRARNSSPCVIFFDELDALCPRRSDSGEGGSSVRVVNQLLTEMDGLEARKQVFIMGATNRPDIIDPAIMRPGRLDKLLYVGLPTVEDRLDILRTVTKNGTKPKLAVDVNLEDIAKHLKCEGFTGADLAALVREAAVTALRELMNQSEPSSQTAVVSMSHFEHALTKVRPSVTAKDQELYVRMKDRIASS